MSDEHLHVHLEPKLSETGHRDIDVHEEIDVDVETDLALTAIIGMVCLAIGILAMVITAIVFAIGFPDTWYEIDAGFDEAKNLVKWVTLGTASSFVLILLGSSLYFYGRTVMGTGSMEQYRLADGVEVHHDA